MDGTAATCILESTWPARFSLPPDIDEACPALVTRAYGRSDRGQVRRQNEDQFLIASPASPVWVQQSNGLPGGMQHVGIDSQLFVVADGMGGHAGGAHASALAVSAVEAAMLSAMRCIFTRQTTDEDQDVGVLAELCTALRRADVRVCEEAERRPELMGMGTTLTVAYRHGSRLFIAHAGDSRGYLLRGDKFYRLTRDHTLVSEMIERGILESEEDARASFRSVITNVVGGTPGVNVEVHRVQLLPGDVLLLCTDGLTGMLPDARIAITLDMYPDPREACERLVGAANEAGGHDNITAIVARCEELQGTER